ncbi:hypothetical protein P1X15_19145 [Runella sp. MFBS21]|uniref:hypothetical protein n=1 Tax=Runella sp. MFBS21 TaxID=3034018 RepID=UPI0023F95865|nr:hypothetical protein [Runella sp. MFBS21]MDF7819745.1 hypothetical protein [Runella sp. MFBS21]
MTDLELIDNYYNNQLSDEAKTVFEKSLQEDPHFASEVAFYVQAKQAAQKEARQRRLAELTALGQQQTLGRARQVYYGWAVAASILLALGISWYVWLGVEPTRSRRSIATEEWATEYISQNLVTLPITMGDIKQDSLKLGINAYNNSELATAKAIWENLYQKDKNNPELEKLLGIVCLRSGDYDQAISYFHRLGARTDLVSNPGKFYEAIALLKKQTPLDKIKAESLLKEVKTNKLEGWKEME